MLIYCAPKSQFLLDITQDNIEDILQDRLFAVLGRHVGQSEYTAWQNSLREMHLALMLSSVPDDATIALEFNIPGSGKRVDFIVAGRDPSGRETVAIVELKQWQHAEKTGKDGVVATYLGRGLQETSHPSYQAWSYAALLSGFNQVVHEEDVRLVPCAYLHNYRDDSIISDGFYAAHIGNAPLFFKGDRRKIADFLNEAVSRGDDGKVMERIEASPLRPSKALADSITGMLKGNREFTLIDEQKIVYEAALDLAKKAKAGKKHVLIVEGGPGTGKSVVAINLLVTLNKLGILSQYVTKNSAPREVYKSKLAGTARKAEISALFTSSGSFVATRPEAFDALIVDEAHRLNEKSGLYGNLGENQIKELIAASKFSVFFVDEDQRVTLKDIGSKEEIARHAKEAEAEIEYLELSSQFRCGGSDGYLAWLDNTLQIRETANTSLDGDYDFRVVDTPGELRDLILEKNAESNKARLLAGYCWDWKSKKNPQVYDIVMPEHDFAMKWNLTDDGSLWILAPESVNEVGCIHTCQGLETDYVGVIVGQDLIVRDGEVLVDPSKRAKADTTVFGYKKLLGEDREGTESKLRSVIKNTYRTLMTRGMKGCYVYFCDEETRKYFSSKI
jgi:uncharacterized protein